MLFITFIILALQLTAHAVPLQKIDASGVVGVAISGPSVSNEYGPGQKRALVSKSKKIVTPTKPAPPVKSTAAAKSASTVKTASSVKPVPPVKSTALAKSASTGKKSSSVKSVPPAKSTAPVTSTSSASSEEVTSGDACVVGGSKAKGGIKRRGCINSKQTNDDTELTDIPALKENEIRLTDERTKSLEVGTVGDRIGSGSSADVFNVDWPPAKGVQQVAKKFKASRAADAPAEVENLRAVGKLTAFGKSTLGPTVDNLEWIVSPFVDGERLDRSQTFSAVKAGPRKDCEAFLAKRCDLLSAAIVQLEAKSKLVLNDITDQNIHWKAFDDTTLPEFFDFGNMISKGQKKETFAQRKVKDTNGFAREACQRIWPVSECKGPAEESADAEEAT